LIYQARRGPLGKPTTWRLENGALVIEGPRAARFELSKLRRVALTDGKSRLAPGERVLSLGFQRRRLVISSHGYGRLGMREDNSAAFIPFARAVIEGAAAAAPGAKFQTSETAALGVYGAVLALTAAGLALTLLATFAVGQYALGLDLGARLAFALILLAAPLPWLKGWRGVAFDPAAPPL
jgi:hypothetical protein